MRIHTLYSASSVCDDAHSTTSAVARIEPTVISERAPWRSIQRPTGKPASAATARPAENAPVISARENPSSASIGRSITGKP